MRTIAAQISIDFFQASNEIQNFFPWNQTACRFAEMRPTTERPVRVDHTAPRLRLEQRTSAILPHRQLLASSGAKRLGGQQGFSLGEFGRQTGEPELTALCPCDALPF